LIVEVPAAQLPRTSLKEWDAFIWGAADRTGHLLFVHKASGSSQHLSFASAQLVTTVREYPALEIAPQTASQPGLLSEIAQRLFRLRVIDAEEVQDVADPIELSAGVFAIEYKLRDAAASPVWKVLTSSGKVLALDIHPNLLGMGTAAELDRAVLQRVLEQRPDHELPRLIHLDPETRAASWYLAETRRSESGSIQVGGAAETRTWKFSNLNVDLAGRLSRTNLLARAVSHQPRLASGRAWLGAKGILVDAGENLWTIRDGGGERPEIDCLAREAFNQWSQESAAKCPSDWQTPELRRELQVETIARTALSDGFAGGDRTREPVNRLGLLQTLARETESTK
jgi:hypothetical protein